MIGGFGTAEVLSFHATKLFSSAEGGAGAVVERIAGMIEQVVAQTIAETGAATAQDHTR